MFWKSLAYIPESSVTRQHRSLQTLNNGLHRHSNTVPADSTYCILQPGASNNSKAKLEEGRNQPKAQNKNKSAHKLAYYDYNFW